MPAFPVLFVCVGNVCRSPFGERLLAHRLADLGATEGDIAVSSAGTQAAVGQPIHPMMVPELEARGLDPSGFASRPALPSLVEGSGLVLAATRAIRARVLEDAPTAFRRTFTVRELAAIAERGVSGGSLADLVAQAAQLRSTLPPGDYDVADPIGRDAAAYARAADELERAVGSIVRLFAG